jgi:hypothetical protein
MQLVQLCAMSRPWTGMCRTAAPDPLQTLGRSAARRFDGRRPKTKSGEFLPVRIRTPSD